MFVVSRASKIWRAKKTFNNRTRQKKSPVNLEGWSRWSRISLPVTIVCSLSFPPLDSSDIALIYPPPFLTQLSKCLGRRKRLKLTHSSVETIFNFLLAGWNESTRRWSPNTSPCHSRSKSRRNAVQIWTAKSCLTKVSILNVNWCNRFCAVNIGRILSRFLTAEFTCRIPWRERFCP